ncbi:aquaporin [Pedobacter yulinensis]|uniref:Aquaporin n=1 Tax=Pedobacter yulinensis TaxID=2126353 RepID=A0A2T3HIE4_9SPHI|nr:MIP/aquaporin family protein [Pedobacter yulinensis]PST82173.1 aquaporin [Pedobacter yulinensis]
MNEFYAELIGTFLVILLGNGVVANVVLTGTKGHGGGWIVITTAWAMAVFVGVVVAAPFSGAHLNPAVTLALAITQKFQWENVPYYILSQLTGGILGATTVWLFYRDHFDATADQGLKRACFCTSPAIKNKMTNLFSEIVGTFVLIFVIFYFTNAELGTEKTPIGLGSIGALPVALLVWVLGLSLGGTTGYAINPVRDFGPRLAHALLPIKGKGDSEWDYAWVPIVGPLIGAVLAGLLYLALNL